MPRIETYMRTLSNGMRVVICPNHTAPVVNVTVMVRVGSHDEVTGKTGLAHLFEHLMFDNTSIGMEKQYDTFCAKAGGSNNAYTTYDYTTYYINLPSHQVEIGFWLESERLRGFNISKHALDTQRSVVTEEINQNVENQPYGSWRHALEQAAFLPESSYSWEIYGSIADVNGVEMPDAKHFFDKYYRASNAVLCVSGDITVERGMELADQYFGSIADSLVPIVRNPFDASWRRTGSHVVVPDSVPMPATFLAYHVPGILDEASYAADIAASILGSGRSSPLYQHLVQSKRIASSVGAFVDKRYHGSLLTICVDAAHENVTADELADAVVEAAKTATVTAGTMTKSVNKLRTALAADLQRVSGVSENVAYMTLFHDDPQLVNTLLDVYARQPQDLVEKYVQLATDVTQQVRVDVVPA